jgi:hypothetical protein
VDRSRYEKGEQLALLFDAGQQPVPAPVLLTEREGCELLGIGRTTLPSLPLRQKHIKRCVRYLASDVERYVAGPFSAPGRIRTCDARLGKPALRSGVRPAQRTSAVRRLPFLPRSSQYPDTLGAARPNRRSVWPWLDPCSGSRSTAYRTVATPTASGSHGSSGTRSMARIEASHTAPRLRLERHRGALLQAVQDGARFDLATGEPESWQLPLAELPIHQRTRRWLAEQWPEWQPRRRTSAAEALARFVLLAVGPDAEPPAARGP